MLAANASGKAPVCVIYHELIYTARPFMRHVLGVERSWLMECRSRMGKASLAQLSGGQLVEETVAEEEAREGKTGGDKGEGGAAGAPAAAVPPPPKERTSQDAVAAARSRFLARKQGAGK